MPHKATQLSGNAAQCNAHDAIFNYACLTPQGSSPASFVKLLLLLQGLSHQLYIGHLLLIARIQTI
jgi:hypothetical protein